MVLAVWRLQLELNIRETGVEQDWVEQVDDVIGKLEWTGLGEMFGVKWIIRWLKVLRTILIHEQIRSTGDWDNYRIKRGITEGP